MLSAEKVLHRIVSGYYGKNADTSTMNNEFCHVLDLAIDCVSSPDTPSTPVPESCPKLWVIDQCLTETEYNTTISQLCLHAKVKGDTNSSSDYSILHCNSSSGMWDSIQDCIVGTNQAEVESVTELPYINQTFAPNLELEEMEKWDQEHMENIRRYEVVGKCVTVGHALSLASLTVAIVLLFFLKRLHCTRIYIHMNLMIAFMLRGLVWILHTTAFADSYSVDEEMSQANMQLGVQIFQQYSQDNLPQLMQWKQEFCDPYDKTTYYIRCRIYFVMLNYTVTANYYWLLVEGLYLGLLLLRAMNPSNNNKTIMRTFLLLGWACPWVSVIGGVVARVVKPDKSNDACWFEDEVGPDWWIINIPILISLLINFIIFVLVVKVVGSKLKSNVRRTDEPQDDYKWRLTKSTLALIPLLGIQYLITVFFEFFHPENANLTFVEKTFELLFTSIQGFMVAFIYCFMNGEIQDEVKRCWRTWKTELEINVSNKRQKQIYHSHTSLTNLYTGFSRKPSAISTTSTRRSDSVYTLGKANGDRSPRPSKQFFTLTEIAENCPVTETRHARMRNSTETSSTANNHFLPEGHHEKENRLSVPGMENGGRHSSTTSDDCVFNSNGAIDNDCFFKPESQNLLSNAPCQKPYRYVDYKTSII